MPDVPGYLRPSSWESEVIPMYPTPDLDTVLAEQRHRVEQAHQRRLARAVANTPSPRRERRAMRLLVRSRLRKPAATPATAAVAGS